MKIYTVEPSAIWLRGRTNKHDVAAKASLAFALNLTDVVQVASREDEDWRRVPGVRFHYLPFADGAFIPQALLDLAVRLAGERRRVLVYCNAGRNRSALFAAVMWRAWRGNVSGEEALLHLQRVRPNALANLAFAEFLRRLP